jgi:hypothetical protein
MTHERKRFLTLSALCICGMIVCHFFSLRHTPHHFEFSLMSAVFLLMNSWLIHSYNSTHRQRDTLIHLFPAPTETSEERS